MSTGCLCLFCRFSHQPSQRSKGVHVGGGKPSFRDPFVTRKRLKYIRETSISTSSHFSRDVDGCQFQWFQRCQKLEPFRLNLASDGESAGTGTTGGSLRGFDGLLASLAPRFPDGGLSKVGPPHCVGPPLQGRQTRKELSENQLHA